MTDTRKGWSRPAWTGALSLLAGFTLTLVSVAATRDLRARSAPKRTPTRSYPTLEDSIRRIDAARIRAGNGRDSANAPAAEPRANAEDRRPIWETRYEADLRALKAFFKRRNAGPGFLRIFGPCPLRPLAVRSARLEAWRRQRRAGDDFMIERSLPALKRLSVRNLATPILLAPDRFQVLAYRLGERIEAIPGHDLGTSIPERAALLKSLLFRSRYAKGGIPPQLRKEMLQSIDDFEDERLRIRYRFWEVAAPVVHAKLLAGMYEREVQGLYVVDGQLHLVRRGQSEAVDRAVDALTRARDETNRTIRDLLR